MTSEHEAEQVSPRHQWHFITTLKYLRAIDGTAGFIIPSQAEQAALAHCLNCTECKGVYASLYQNLLKDELGHVIARNILPIWQHHPIAGHDFKGLTNQTLTARLEEHVRGCRKCILFQRDGLQRELYLSMDTLNSLIADMANGMFNAALTGDSRTKVFLHRWLGVLSDERERLTTLEVMDNLPEDIRELSVFNRYAFETFPETELRDAALMMLRPFTEVIRQRLQITLLEISTQTI